MRQELIWMPQKSETELHASISWPDGKSVPKRVWTLIGPETPSLPITPRHFYNAFLEDKTHDWTISNGRLFYYSRLTDGGVWLLLEWDE
jgi:hypothetical protein